MIAPLGLLVSACAWIDCVFGLREALMMGVFERSRGISRVKTRRKVSNKAIQSRRGRVPMVVEEMKQEGCDHTAWLLTSRARGREALVF